MEEKFHVTGYIHELGCVNENAAGLSLRRWLQKGGTVEDWTEKEAPRFQSGEIAVKKTRYFEVNGVKYEGIKQAVIALGVAPDEADAVESAARYFLKIHPDATLQDYLEERKIKELHKKYKQEALDAGLSEKDACEYRNAKIRCQTISITKYVKKIDKRTERRNDNAIWNTREQTYNNAASKDAMLAQVPFRYYKKWAANGEISLKSFKEYIAVKYFILDEHVFLSLTDALRYYNCENCYNACLKAINRKRKYLSRSEALESWLDDYFHNINRRRSCHERVLDAVMAKNEISFSPEMSISDLRDTLNIDITAIRDKIRKKLSGYEKLLEYANIKWENFSKYRFDSFIPSSSQPMLADIDGMQHFVLESENGIYSFKQTKSEFYGLLIRDKIKNLFTKYAGIPLLRINPAALKETDEEMEDIVVKFVKNPETTDFDEYYKFMDIPAELEQLLQVA